MRGARSRISIDRRTVIKLSGGLLGGIATGSTVVAAERTDRFLVDLAGRASIRKLEAAGLEIVHDLSEIDIAVVSGAEADLERVTTDYAPDTAIDLNLPVEHTTAAEGNADELVPDDQSATDEPFYGLQWDKQVQSIPDAHAEARGEGTRVAIVDTGVANTHRDLSHAVDETLSKDFTGDGYGAPGPWGGFHGTHVAGIVAANDQNEEGVVGTAPATEIVDCRVFSFESLASFADVIAAHLYAVAVDSDVVNMSLGAYPIPRQEIGEFYGRVLNRAVNYAISQGTLLVASAGNAGADLQHDKNFISLPNEAAGAMSISATGPIGYLWDADGDGDVADFVEPPESPAVYTNYGTNAIDLGAPGGDADLDAIGTGVPWFLDLVFNTIALPDPENLGNRSKVTYTYAWVAGTSMAAPQVAGAAALVRSQRPDATPGDVESVLESAASVPDEYDKTFYGAGFLDPAAAVRGETNDSGNGDG